MSTASLAAHDLRIGDRWTGAASGATFESLHPSTPARSPSAWSARSRRGIGRESGVDAVREFTETKTVWVELDGATRDPFVLG